MVKKFISKNELDIFHLHDCYIKYAQLNNENLFLTLSHVNVLAENNYNSTGIAKQTDEAVIKISGCKVERIIEKLPVKQPNSVAGTANCEREYDDFYEIIESLKNAEIMESFIDANNMVLLLFINNLGYSVNGLFEIRMKFDEYIISWNKFMKDAYFTNR